MSAGGSFGGARGFQPRPPEKGVFPLDHFGECKSVRGRRQGLLALAPGPAPKAACWVAVVVRCSAGSLLQTKQLIGLFKLHPLLLRQIKEQYLECLKANGSDSEACRELAKAYLKCRMDR